MFLIKIFTKFYCNNIFAFYLFFMIFNIYSMELEDIKTTLEIIDTCETCDINEAQAWGNVSLYRRAIKDEIPCPKGIRLEHSILKDVNDLNLHCWESFTDQKCIWAIYDKNSKEKNFDRSKVEKFNFQSNIPKSFLQFEIVFDIEKNKVFIQNHSDFVVFLIDKTSKLVSSKSIEFDWPNKQLKTGVICSKNFLNRFFKINNEENILNDSFLNIIIALITNHRSLLDLSLDLFCLMDQYNLASSLLDEINEDKISWDNLRKNIINNKKIKNIDPVIVFRIGSIDCSDNIINTKDSSGNKNFKDRFRFIYDFVCKRSIILSCIAFLIAINVFINKIKAIF